MNVSGFIPSTGTLCACVIENLENILISGLVLVEVWKMLELCIELYNEFVRKLKFKWMACLEKYGSVRTVYY